MKATTALLVALVFGGALAFAAPEEAGFEDLPAAKTENALLPIGRQLKGGWGHDDGCSCADSWTYKGCVYHGCSDIDSPGKPWCVVKPGCGSCDGYSKYTFPPNMQWKYCKPSTPAPKPQPKPQPNCNCKPVWTYKKCDYKGCSDVDSPGKPWCVVYDSCDKYDGVSKGQKWKYCPKPAAPPATCYCLASWWYKGCEYKGCSEIESKGKPWCVVNPECPYPDGVSASTHPANQKWKYCPTPEKPKPPPVTCKCADHYVYKGCTYSGCIKVDSPWKPWCVVNDDCPYYDGIEKKTTPPNKKYMYCKH